MNAKALSFIMLSTMGVLSSSPTGATSMETANNLGSVIAAEKFCGLKYDQEAISKFIQANVKDTDIGFASTLSSMVNNHKFIQESMSKSQKTAHCHQISRVAKRFGFVK